MMKGYFRNESMSKNSFHEYKGKTYYRTGDLVQLKQDGFYYFIGRKDRQVKINGARVELSSIDEVLQKFEEIDTAICFVSNQENKKELKAVFQSKKNIDIDEVFIFVRQRLPKNSIPSTIQQIEEIPRTKAGKIDFRQLETNY